MAARRIDDSLRQDVCVDCGRVRGASACRVDDVARSAAKTVEGKRLFA